MAKSKWMVDRRIERKPHGRREYRAYKLIDPEKPDAEWNRQHRGEWSPDRAQVEALVYYLNEKEAAT